MALDAESIRRAKEFLSRIGPEEALCERVVAVLGDENYYPCMKQAGHPGPCVPDYDAAT